MELFPDNVQFTKAEPFVLESGSTLQDYRVQYSTYGRLNADNSNVVWVFHALTANSLVHEWWTGLIGPNRLLDSDKYFIICSNMLGSCYGAEEPHDFNFPLFTIKDMVQSHKLIKQRLGIEQIKMGIGGSMGGQQLLQWAAEEPDLFETVVPIATNAVHSSWGIAFNETQRMAIRSGNLQAGLEVARAIGMLSYRHYTTFEKKQTDQDHRISDFSASSYQRYQGEKLRKRFSPYSYYYLSKAMDSHNLGRYYGSAEEALQRIKSKAVVVGMESDILFPKQEQIFIADYLPNADIYIVESDFGHDGFLIETKKINDLLKNL